MHTVWFLVVVLMVSIPLPAAAGQLDPECIVYMEAKAAYEAAIAETKPRGMFGAMAERLIGPSDRDEEIRNAAMVELYLAYKHAYRGPHGTEEQYTAMLIADDVVRCMLDNIMSDMEWVDGLEPDADIEDGETLADLLDTLGYLKKEENQ